MRRHGLSSAREGRKPASTDTDIGWLVRVTTLNSDGTPAIYQSFVVCEPDQEIAARLTRTESIGRERQTVEVLALIGPREIKALGLRRGVVRPI